jgi:hypothetical protein
VLVTGHTILAAEPTVGRREQVGLSWIVGLMGRTEGMVRLQHFSEQYTDRIVFDEEEGSLIYYILLAQP